MTEQKTMELVIRYEYEKEQLGEYKPMKFEKWLLKTLAQERVKSSLGDVSEPFVCRGCGSTNYKILTRSTSQCKDCGYAQAN